VKQKWGPSPQIVQNEEEPNKKFNPKMLYFSILTKKSTKKLTLVKRIRCAINNKSIVQQKNLI
jgi:hypothetical protein